MRKSYIKENTTFKSLIISMAMMVLLASHNHLYAIVIRPCVSGTAVPAVTNIKSIRAYTGLCFYGQKLTKVEITYLNNVDLSMVSPATYVLLDRGYANPEFTPATIKSVSHKGNVVTLNITVVTEALENNALIYIGDNATGARSKNPVGLYATGPWYRAVDGNIYYGKKDSLNYKANVSGDGYQTRPCLELKLYHSGETEKDAACLANQDGTYNAAGLWQPTIDGNYGTNGFRNFETLGIQVPTTSTDGDKFVRGWAYFPEDFDKDRKEKYQLIITITGYGTSYWKHDDGTNNFGTGLNFDGSGFRWMKSGAIVLNIHDRSHTGGSNYKFFEDDYNVIQYFIKNCNADPGTITLTGNSRGTIACNTIAATYPGLIKTLILNNGSMGNGMAGKPMFEGAWTDQIWEEIAKSGTRIWVFDGELDTDNKEIFKKTLSFYKDAGRSDEWINENIRLSGFPTGLYYYWGETDHSTAKMTYWYFFDKPYYGPDAKIVDGELVYNKKLKKDDTYQLKGRMTGGKNIKAGFEYIIYDDTLREWVLSSNR